jgi:hypothetical protein
MKLIFGRDVQLVPVGNGFYVAHSLTGEMPGELRHVRPEEMSKPVLRVGTEAEWKVWMNQHYTRSSGQVS